MTRAGRSLVVVLGVVALVLALPRSAASPTSFEHAARVAAQRYRDVAVAGADGYTGPLSVAGAVHLVRVDRVVGPGGTIDPTRPSALLYEHDHGRYELRAAVYVLAEHDRQPPGALRGLDWHRHTICAGPLGLREAPDGHCGPVERAFASGLMAHVWLPARGDAAVVCLVPVGDGRSAVAG